jgi:hypothetical protein
MRVLLILGILSIPASGWCQYIWNGSVSDAWTSVANWDYETEGNPSVSYPNSTTADVTIGSKTYNPRISSIIQVGDIMILGGVELTFGGTPNLMVYGNLWCDGSIYTEPMAISTLTFNGSQHNIEGYADIISIKRVSIGHGNVLSVWVPLEVGSQFSLISGYVFLYANLKISPGGSLSVADSKYIVTEEGGSITRQVGPATGPVMFPVSTFNGVSYRYAPVMVTNPGTADMFTVHVKAKVYENGYNPASTRITEAAVDKTWYISEEVPGGTNATIKFTWPTDDVLPGFDASKCRLMHYNSSSTRWEALQSEGAATVSSGYSTRESTGVTSFSPFGASTGNDILPVVFTSFEARPENGVVRLGWATASELNNDYFMVQRSADGIVFTDVQQVAGSGTSHVLREYSATDPAPLTGLSFYRIKQVDFDGTMDFSELRQVVSAPETARSVSFSYRGEMFTDRLPGMDGGETELTVYDLSGRVMHSTSFYPGASGGREPAFQLPASIDPGLYLMRYRSASAEYAGRIHLR